MDIIPDIASIAGVSTAVEGTALIPGQAIDSSSNQVTVAGQVEAPADKQITFNDALLSIINSLLQEQGKDPKMQAVAGMTDEDRDEPIATPDDLTAPPQQMLDALLMASQLPIKPVTLSNTASQSGETVLMSYRSASSVAPVVMATPEQANSTLPVTQPVIQPTTQPVVQQGSDATITRGIQSVISQPGASTFSEAASAVTTAVQGQNNTISSPEKQSALATLKLEGGEDRWAQQLQSALGERLQVQVKNQIQHATIRLDPPDMGKIDISMQIENGRMQVHINASQGEVYRALQQVSNDLRQSLTEQNFVQVNVQVSSQSGQQHNKEPQFAKMQTTVQAAAEVDNDSQQTDRREDESVLLTV